MASLNRSRELLVEEFLKCLDENYIPWEKPWKNLHINASTNIEYKGINAAILGYYAMKRGYNDPRWLTFNQIQKAGYKLVDAKNQGVHIEFWSLYDKKEKKILSNAEAMQCKKDDLAYFTKNVILMSKCYCVFNARHIEGLEPYQENEKNFNKNELLESITNNYLENEHIELKHHDSKAYYSPTYDYIAMPKIEQFQTVDDYYATLLHEIGHSTGHSKRLNRDLSGNFGSISYAKEELRAEISSAFLFGKVNLEMPDNMLDNHKAYIQSWISILKEKPDELFRAIHDADTINDYVLKKANQLELIKNDKQQLEESPTKEKKRKGKSR